MRVTVYSSKPFEIPYLERANTGNHEFIFLKERLMSDTAALASSGQAVAVFTNDDVSSTVLEAIKKACINFIVTRSAGYDNIDIEAARKLGIKVSNVPEYSPYSVAEHAASMIMAMNRKLIRADKKVKDYNFLLDDLIGFDLNGKTAGIVGLGKIGAVLAKILNGFGCKLLGFDPAPNKSLTQKYGLDYVDLDTLCKESDIISIHAPLNQHTKHLFDKNRFDMMKQGVMVVNTGRGPIIDTADAIEALKSGKIGALGLDVFEYEKGLFFYDHTTSIPKDDLFARLLTFKNVLITGHQAFLTENALQNIADTTLYNLNQYADNKPAVNELT